MLAAIRAALDMLTQTTGKQYGLTGETFFAMLSSVAALEFLIL
jgi:hypothetical protein